MMRIEARQPRVRVSGLIALALMRDRALSAIFTAALVLFSLGFSGASAASVPPPPAADATEDDAGAARHAVQAIDAGFPAEAAGILETLVAPRHHMLSILPEWHRDLARAYVALGLFDGAEGQFRLALAAASDGEAGALGEELEAFLAKAGAADALPDTLGPNGAKYFDLHWVDRGSAAIDFATAFALPEDGADGVAFTTATYRADCLALKSHLLGGAAFSRTGEKLRSFGEGESARPANDLADHSLRMICRRDPELKVKKLASIDGRTLTARYRAQRVQRTVPTAPSTQARSAYDAACRAHVEMFVGQLAADGQVSGPSWQVRDWWDIRTEQLSADRRAAANSATAALANADPVAARAFQLACVQEALARGAAPGL
jgi:hypothetical protein